MTDLMWAIVYGLFCGLICYFPVHYILKEEALKMPVPFLALCWLNDSWFTAMIFGVIGHFIGFGIMRAIAIEKKTKEELIRERTKDRGRIDEEAILPFRPVTDGSSDQESDYS